MIVQRKSVAFGIFLIFLWSWPLSGLSQNVEDVLRISRQGITFNGRSLGMGNAYSTFGNDLAALRMNPASLGLSEEMSYTMAINTNRSQNASTFFGSTTDFTSYNTNLSQAGFTFPVRLDSTRKAVFGFGYTQSVDFDGGEEYNAYNQGGASFTQLLVENPNDVARALGLTYSRYDGAGRYLGDQTVLRGKFQERGYVVDGGYLLHFSAGVSVQAVPGVLCGVSGNYNLGTYDTDREFRAEDVAHAYPTSLRTNPTDPQTAGFIDANYRDVRTSEYKGWDVRFGLVYRFESDFGISASFKVPFVHSVTGTKYLSGTSRFATGASFEVKPAAAPISYTITPPYEATAGVMVNLWDLTGTAEATYVDYTQMKYSGGGDVTAQSDINKRIKDELTRILNLNVGAEFGLPFTGLVGRAGAMYRPSPYKGDASRYDQKFLSLGIGISTSNILHFDIGYMYGWWGQKRVDLQTPSDSNIEQTIIYQNAIISMKFVL